jgi:hypothetical protein
MQLHRFSSLGLSLLREGKRLRAYEEGEYLSLKGIK